MHNTSDIVCITYLPRPTSLAITLTWIIKFVFFVKRFFASYSGSAFLWIFFCGSFQKSKTGGGGGSDGGGGGGGGGEDDVYDLFAAVHHIGTMNGGHYVASCRVEKTNGDGGDWYNFNDSHVSKVDEKSIVSPTGYILFYKRRELSSANVINLSM